MPTYQGAARLATTLPRLLESMGPRDELIVKVDGSTDGTADLVRHMTAGNDKVRVLESAANWGRTAALNSACRSARGEYVVRVDDDIKVPGNFLTRIVEAHQQSDGPVGIVPLLEERIGAKKGTRRWMAFVERNRAATHGRWRVRPGGAPAAAWGGVCSVARSAGEELGWYDTSYSAYGWEDIDFGHRLIRHGLVLLILDDVSVVHHSHNASFSHKLLRNLEAGRRMAVFAQKWGAHGVLEALGESWRNREVPDGYRREEGGVFLPEARSSVALRRSMPRSGWPWWRIGRMGERILSISGPRRAYDGWVARWLTAAYRAGWEAELTDAGIPPLPPPQSWEYRSSGHGLGRFLGRS